MKFEIYSDLIPGTRLSREAYGNLTGRDFIRRIFYLDDSIMLGQVRAITGIDTSTLQNWVKRGWLMNTVNRRYSQEHLARILIINMLRSVIQLEEIDRLLHYVNGEVETTDDDLLTEVQFYDLCCRCIDRVAELDRFTIAEIRVAAERSYAEITVNPDPDAADRIVAAMCVVVPAYLSSLLANHVRDAFDALDLS